jgi:hypothetical protein
VKNLLDVLHWVERSLFDLLNMKWFAGWGLPAVLAVLAGSFRAMSREDGPLLALLLDRPNLPPEDRAFGLDLIFAAVGLQLGFIALKAIEAHSYKELDYRGFWVTIGVAVITVPWIRMNGYQQAGGQVQLRQRNGVAVPNIVGFFLLAWVYNLNT